MRPGTADDVLHVALRCDCASIRRVATALGTSQGRLAQSKITAVIAADQRLGANEFFVRQLGKRIVEIAPGRGTQIDCGLSTEIIRDRAPDHVEGGSTVGGNGIDEVTGRIEGKT